MRFRLVNVFTREGAILSGNPLCVFEDATGLDDVQMQALALQFNLSETTFIFPSSRADARVRIFTPGYEMPFAGHPTLGTAFVVQSLLGLGPEVSLELNVGVVPVQESSGLWELRAPASKARPAAATRGELATALGLEEGDVSAPALWVDSGSEQLIVPLATPEAVRGVRLSYDALCRVTADGPRAQAYVFAADGPETLLSRFFFSNASSVLEDPATGSATANLGGWYLARQAPLPLTRWIAQGEQAGRPSALRLSIDATGSVFVAGAVAELGRGTLQL